MKKIIALCAFVLSFIIFSESTLAQNKLDISDIEMVNLGDTRLYAHKRDADKTPLNGKVRIITGFTTEYIDATFKDGYPIGSWEYYKENKLNAALNYKDGYRDGEYKEFYPTSGKIKEKGQYAKGRKTGTWEQYKNDGIVKLTEVFNDDNLTKKVTYYTDGKVDTERNFKNGKENGPVKQYTWEGELKSEKNYVDGKQVGKQVQYYTSNAGNYIQTSYYDENGTLDGEFQEVYADNNAIKVKGKYKAGRKIGKWIYGYPHQLYKEETYENGKLVETTKLNE